MRHKIDGRVGAVHAWVLTDDINAFCLLPAGSKITIRQTAVANCGQTGVKQGQEVTTEILKEDFEVVMISPEEIFVAVSVDADADICTLYVDVDKEVAESYVEGTADDYDAIKYEVYSVAIGGEGAQLEAGLFDTEDTDNEDEYDEGEDE
jgi:hypothetical protein